MVTDEKALKDYEKAADAYDKLSNSLELRSEARQEAAAQRDKLTIEFIGQQIEEVKKRTAKYAEFINEMENFIKRVEKESSGPIDALNAMKQIVDEGSTILEALKEENG